VRYTKNYFKFSSSLRLIDCAINSPPDDLVSPSLRSLKTFCDNRGGREENEAKGFSHEAHLTVVHAVLVPLQIDFPLKALLAAEHDAAKRLVVAMLSLVSDAVNRNEPN
jgi:hypothetical protein